MLDLGHEQMDYDRKTGKPLPELLDRLGLEALRFDVLSVLRRVGDRHPELREALWTRGASRRTSGPRRPRRGAQAVRRRGAPSRVCVR
jgi:hypothetical protein